MGKVFSVALLTLCFICTSAFAGGSGNCIQPLKTTTDNFGTGASFGYNYVGHRLMALYNYDRDETDLRVKDVSQAYGQIPIGLDDNHNLLLKIGVCDYKLYLKDRDKSQDTVRIDLDSGVYAGVGMNSLFPLWDFSMPAVGPVNIGWGYEIQGNAYLNDLDVVDMNMGVATDVDGSLLGFDGQESLYLTARYDVDAIETSIIPYIGIYHSWIVVSELDDITYTRSDNKTGNPDGLEIEGAFDALSFGLLLGADLEITKYANLNVEGRFIGETAVTTGATIKF